MKRLTLLFSIVAMSALVNAQEVKIGYIDSQRIFSQSQDYKDAQAKFDKELEAWNAQAEQMRKEIEAMQKELEGQSLILSAEKKREKEQALASKQDTLNQFLNATFGADGKAERRMAELSKPIRDKILEIIEKVAIENNYSLVLDAGTVNIAYAKKSLDLTDEVLAEMSEQQK